MALTLDGNGTMSVGNGDITGITAGSIESTAIGSGAILQVVQTANSTLATVSSSSFADTGFYGTITPTRSTSKILVMINCMGRHMSAGMNPNYRISRNNGAAYSGTVSDFYHPSGSGVCGNVNIQWLDSPGTTSPVTYAIQWSTAGAGGSVIFNSDYNNNNIGVTYVTMMEIAA